MSFLAGCLATATVWAVFSWWRNPHGHRGGESTQLLCGEPITVIDDNGKVARRMACQRAAGHDGACNAHVPENVEAVAPNYFRNVYSLPVRYHRTG